ncbi:MAG TPA: hypothetical protein GXX51_10735 [Firmicutes bacterium]|nr:hypothetical protein [Bacillota bacterium]
MTGTLVKGKRRPYLATVLRWLSSIISEAITNVRDAYGLHRMDIFPQEQGIDRRVVLIEDTLPFFRWGCYAMKYHTSQDLAV